MTSSYSQIGYMIDDNDYHNGTARVYLTVPIEKQYSMHKSFYVTIKYICIALVRQCRAAITFLMKLALKKDYKKIFSY